MSLVLALIITPLAAYALSKPLHRLPLFFYGIALLACALGLYLVLVPSVNPLLKAYANLIQRGHVAIALFALVMFVGVFSEGSRFRCALMPVRSELSLLACILVCGHFIPYLSQYIGMLSNSLALKASVAFSLFVAFALLIFLTILSVTSITFVKRHMSTMAWKRIQCLAYPFFAFIYLHLLGYFLPSALHGAASAVLTLSTYTVVFAAYLILRIKKAIGKTRTEHGRQS
jgi:DMSO/TMAO reductase YedYZ heme-binding membrane subunit